MSSIAYCAVCGAPLTTKRPNPKFCSKACMGVAFRQILDRPCAHCAAPFRPSHQERAYCSKACADAARRQHVAHTCACEQCGALFSSLQNHRNRFCSMLCFRAHVQATKYLTRKVCEFCSATFETEREEARFCSQRCATKDDSRQGRVLVYCDGCGALVEKQKCKVNAAASSFCSAACRAVWRASTKAVQCRGCGAPFRVGSGDARPQTFCTKPCYQQWLHMQTSSKLEQRVGASLGARGIAVAPQFPLCGFIYDYVVEDRRVLLEVDGTYWHSLPRAKDRDRAKDIVAYRNGWRLLRVAEADLTAAWDKTIERIVQAILQ